MATKKPTTKALAKKPALPAGRQVSTKAVVKAERATTAIAKAPKAAKAVVPAAKKADKAPKLETGALVAKFRTHKDDTGSTEVQIATMTEQMNEVSAHLKLHPKDHDARRGLLVMVGKRRRLLNYLARTNEGTYQAFIQELKLRK